MPYIKQEDRLHYDARINSLITDIKIHKSSAGDMNYIISRLLGKAFDLKNPSYKNINEAIGVLECVKLELYSRIAVILEQQKCIINGDIPEYKEFVDAQKSKDGTATNK